MSHPFNHCIEVYGVQLIVTGTYHPAINSAYFEPPEPSLIELERVSVSGSDVNIDVLLCDKTKTRIEETIERIEGK